MNCGMTPFAVKLSGIAEQTLRGYVGHFNLDRTWLKGISVNELPRELSQALSGVILPNGRQMRKRIGLDQSGTFR
jgi:hypothetical protein